DDRPGAGEPPGLGDGSVLLAYVHAVRARLPGQVRPVVEDEDGAVAARRAGERLGVGDDLLGAARLLLAELDRPRPGRERGLQQRLGVAAAGPRVADEVEPHPLELRRRHGFQYRASREAGVLWRPREPSTQGLRGRHPGRRPSEPDPGNAGAGMVARTARPARREKVACPIRTQEMAGT